MQRKLGALAFLRNLRNMEQAGVDSRVITKGFRSINARWLLPLNFVAAATVAPQWMREIETLMLSSLSTFPKLPGQSVLVVDVSGSMGQKVSSKSHLTRLEVGAVLALIASELCERVQIYVTAGSDSARIHSTKRVGSYRGFALTEKIVAARSEMGGGGIFTRQCLEYLKGEWRDSNPPDRIIIFSDSQDCDSPRSGLPQPFGKKNYIIDVAAHNRGINYAGRWTAEISGWSENFLNYIFAAEGLELAEAEENEE